jgi:hypothetical protein
MDDRRVKTEAIVERLRNEPGFRESVQRDPAGVLRAAGLPDDLIVDFSNGMSDVQMHQYCQWTCVKNTSECTKSYLV